MILPKFTVGSKVEVISTKELGAIKSINIAAVLEESGNKVNINCLVEFKGGKIKTYKEEFLKDAPTSDNKIDKFLINSLLLSRKLDPDKIDNTIREMTNSKGDAHGISNEGLLS